MSASFFERTKRVSDNVEGLALEATASHVTLANTLTKVSLLAHTKFIESVSLYFLSHGRKLECAFNALTFPTPFSPPFFFSACDRRRVLIKKG